MQRMKASLNCTKYSELYPHILQWQNLPPYTDKITEDYENGITMVIVQELLVFKFEITSESVMREALYNILI
jgi:hypothetical protein